MGGIEGARGYVYQGVVAVLEALTMDGWDEISVEFPTQGDKVDIALRNNGSLLSAIQVKSTEESFSKPDVVRWIHDIVKDCDSQHYRVVLVGNCSQGVANLSKALSKSQAESATLTKQDKEALCSFDQQLIGRRKIELECLPFSREILIGVVRDALNSYLSKRGKEIPYTQVSLLADAMIARQLLNSTKGEFVSRVEMEQELMSNMELFLENKRKEYNNISIVSFPDALGAAGDDVILLDIHDMFDGRLLKPQFDWNQDVKSQLEHFFENIDQSKPYTISIDAPSSIAFFSGRCCRCKVGFDIFPMQKEETGKIRWNLDETDNSQFPALQTKRIPMNAEATDIALVLSISRSALSQAISYIKEKSLPVKTIYNCTIGDCSSNNVRGGTHAVQLARKMSDFVLELPKEERMAVFHLFAAAPNGLMFRLGQQSECFGKTICYEYDFTLEKDGSYSPSITF